MKKFIVTNKSCLKKKYLNNFLEIQAAFQSLISADKAAGITTTVVYMDDKDQMSSLNATVITSATDDKQAKDAIDSLFTKQNPDYMTIFGAPDVVVMQSLDNPTLGDGDATVLSDLPYACNAGYSKSINNFLAPSRDITRLPDLNGGTDSTYPLRVIANAANSSRLSADDYLKSYFAISTESWEQSTQTSVNNIFGNITKLNISPPSGPKWSNSQLQSMSQFFNLHGGRADPNFYNESNTRVVESCINSSDFISGLSENMVVSAECCYGAELYAPGSDPMGICNAAMYSGCGGYFGSTCIAYGPSAGQGAADIITQRFLIRLFAGDSVGQAALSARTDFIAAAAMRTPTNLKTLGQFVVYGNGGHTPAKAVQSETRQLLEQKGFSFTPENFRQMNERVAIRLRNTVDTSNYLPDKNVPDFVQNIINEIINEVKPESHVVSCHQVVFNIQHRDVMENPDNTFIYTIVSHIPLDGLPDRYIVHHIEATDEHIVNVSEYYSK